MHDATIVREVLSAISVPRLTGTPGWERTTDWLHHRLIALGYTVTRQPFSYSDWPVRLGPPLIGVLTSSGFGTAWLLLRAARPLAAVIALVLLQAAIALILVLFPRALLRLRFGRREGINLFAGPPRPRHLIVAHHDSKSQPVPMALRLLAVAVAIASWLLLATGAALQAVAIASPVATGLLASAGVAAGLVLAACTVGNASPGALDNASGVAALIAIASRMKGHDGIAFLVTDAEEAGMAGASAAAGGLAFLSGVINLDGLDDRGPIQLMGPHGTPRRGGAPRLEAALAAAAHSCGVASRSRAVPRGLMVDHIAFTRAGVPAITVMRGTLRSIVRVHRPSDNLERLRGDGAVLAADIVCRALASLDEGAEPVAREPGRH